MKCVQRQYASKVENSAEQAKWQAADHAACAVRAALPSLQPVRDAQRSQSLEDMAQRESRGVVGRLYSMLDLQSDRLAKH